MAKKDNTIWIVIGIIVLILILLNSNILNVNLSNSGSGDSLGNGGSSGSSGGGNQNIQNQLSISVTPINPCKGDMVSGYITSNMPGVSCIIQYRFSDLMVWQTLATVILDPNGRYTQQAPANNIGSITFRAVCNSIVSNEQTVTVKNCPPATPTYNCFDSDLGLDFTVFGNCQSNFDNVGHMDGCVSGETYMREYYCDGNGICQWIPNTNWLCNQMSCDQIVHPSSQASCDLGNCISGLTCSYIPATLVAPARCGCAGVG